MSMIGLLTPVIYVDTYQYQKSAWQSVMLAYLNR